MILNLAGGLPKCIKTYGYDDEDCLRDGKRSYHYIYRGYACSSNALSSTKMKQVNTILALVLLRTFHTSRNRKN